MIRLDERCEAFLNELEPMRYINIKDITEFKIKEKNANDFDVSSGGVFNKMCSGQLWGGKDKYFQLQVVVNADFDGGNFFISFDIDRAVPYAQGVQALLFVDSEPKMGLDYNHTQCLICDNAVKGKEYVLDIICYCGTNEQQFSIGLRTFSIDNSLNKLYYDIKVPFDVCRELTLDNDKTFPMLERLSAAINLLDFRNPYSQEFYASIDGAAEYLRAEFYGKYCDDRRVTEAVIGHTHIDVAWLWPLAVTKDKAVRSFATVLALMDRYPEYIFMSSQPQLYMFVKQYCPEVYAKIKERVEEGRWEAEGGMFLEADCNLTGGESLIRQIVYGKKFFKEEFNKDSQILWLPDVFGYSAALPQILKKSGIKYFMTTKINWNDTNKLPCDTFNWRGLDGSEVFSHFITTSKYHPIKNEKQFYTTYNGDTDANSMLGCWQRYQHKDINSTVLNCYGYGDGGGGPTAEMLERIRRYKGIPGCPVAEPMKVKTFFDNVFKKVHGNKRLKTWVGELYFEYHRGTLTTMAKNKKNNRKAEFKALDTEFLYALSNILGVDSSYPKSEMDRQWQTIMLNQFHDILPGTAIKEVYNDSQKQYQELFENFRKMESNVVSKLIANVRLENCSAVVFNQLSFKRSDYVTLDMQNVELYDSEKRIASQATYDGRTIFFATDIPAKGYKTFNIKKCSVQKNAPKKFQSKFYDFKLDKNGNFISIFDRENNREILNGVGNQFVAYEDKPLLWDAWEIRNYYREKSYLVNDLIGSEIVECGDVRTVLKVKRKYCSSTLEQDIIISDLTKRIDFQTTVDWKENRTLLKVEFPLDINSTQATYDVQFGNVSRNTHSNTSWDEAKFESCAHKWADLSEGNYGVALLNDCKYGYGVFDSVMTLSLLRSSIEPNPTADREVHNFTYSLYPHTGNHTNGVVTEGYNLNCPLICGEGKKHAGKLKGEFSLLNVNSDNIIVETVKHAENEDAYIIRMYESCNGKTSAKCNLYFNVQSVYECDLLENNQAEIVVEGNSFDFTIDPFEIKTYKIIL